MSSETDKQFRAEAITLLDKNLLGFGWKSYIDKKKLLTMYAEAKSIHKQQKTGKKLSTTASSVFETVVRIVRCLCIEDPQAKMTNVRGRDIEMDAEALYGSAEAEFKQMRKLANQK